MEVKLKSIFREPLLALVLKSAIFGGFLILLKLGEFGILPILFFLWAALLLSSGSHHVSFLILLVISTATIWILDSWLFLLLAVVLFAALFYLTVGIKELLFVHRWKWSFVRNLILFFGIFLLFFLADKSSFFLIKYLSVFLACFLLLREWFLALEPRCVKRPFLVALLLAFIIFELLWAVTLLPLGAVNAAALMVLITYLLFDFISHHFQGTISRQLVLRRITIFTLLVLLIFGTSKWEIG